MSVIAIAQHAALRRKHIHEHHDTGHHHTHEVATGENGASSESAGTKCLKDYGRNDITVIKHAINNVGCTQSC